jgi:hypothetical protein
MPDRPDSEFACRQQVGGLAQKSIFVCADRRRREVEQIEDQANRKANSRNCYKSHPPRIGSRSVLTQSRLEMTFSIGPCGRLEGSDDTPGEGMRACGALPFPSQIITWRREVANVKHVWAKFVNRNGP